MPQVQTRLDLPTRKPRSCTGKRDETPTRTGRRKLIAPMENPDNLLRTPTRRNGDKLRDRSGTPARDGMKTPGKRNGDAVPDEDVSPTKSLRICDNLKENSSPNIKMQSPSVHLARLSLNSPRLNLRSPLGIRTTLAVSPSKGVKRGNLFSPKKLNPENIETILFSPSKASSANILNIQVDDDISFRSPVKPKSPHPAAKSPRHSIQISPVKSLFLAPVAPGKSPGKSSGLTVDDVENLLCSPAKSPRHLKPSRPSVPLAPVANLFKKPTASPLKISSANDLEDLLCSPAKARSPRKSLLPVKSPRKAVTPVKSPRKGAANLFSSPVKAPTPAKPETPSSLFKADVTQFQNARQALHTGTPSELLCRSEQVQTMSTWLDKHLLKHKPGSLYVSGAPGTGKTATLSHLLGSKLGSQTTVFINCMILKSSVGIYKEVAKQLNAKSAAKGEKEALKEIEKIITAKGEMILLVLDEVDQLESKNQDVLYTVFEWPALSGSRLSLVGIANTLDLTDRVLPRLKIKECYRPTLLHYPPYNKQQIMEIITKRLAASGVETDVIAPRAIAYLAGKISTLSGDIRKALDVCRRALEQAETNTRKQTLLKPLTPRGLNSPTKSPHKGYKVPKPVSRIGQVDLPQIMKVINQVYGSKLNSCMSGAGGIPTQQKILVASLLLMVKKGTSKEVTFGRLLETYNKVCVKRGMVAGEETECVGMIQGLESRGMVGYISKGAPRYAKVSLRLDEKEVEMALEDKTLLSSIINDISCLS
jgi:cell division control protein 6